MPVKHATIPGPSTVGEVGYSEWAADHAITGWRDMLGQIVPRANVATSPTWTQMGASPFWAYRFQLNDEVWMTFHLQHDYKPASDIFIHVHWTSDGTNTATTKWQFDWCYAKGYDQGNFDINAGNSTTVEQAGVGTAWRHMIAEISTPISSSGFEVDGLLLVHIKRITNGGTNNTDNIFVQTIDCHYETESFATVSKNYPFYS